MKVVKRGNIAVLSLTLMIVIAGYINYRYDPEREEDLGKTVLVNSTDSYVYGDIYNEVSTREETLYKDKSKEAVHKIKSERENMYSELEETYSKVIATSTSEENIKIYQDKLDNLIKEKHKINLIETLIKTKGIESLAITKTDGNITVLVGTSKLKEAEIAIIKKIIQDEFNIDTKYIKITQQ